MTETVSPPVFATPKRHRFTFLLRALLALILLAPLKPEAGEPEMSTLDQLRIASKHPMKD